MELMGVLLLFFLTIPAFFGYFLIFFLIFLMFFSEVGVFIMSQEVDPEPLPYFIKNKKIENEIQGTLDWKTHWNNQTLNSSKNKVLIIEDDLSLRPFWMRIFKNISNPPDFEWAISGEEALEKINATNHSQNSFKLIICDLFLAGSQTGLEILNSQSVINSKAKTILVSAVNYEDLKTQFNKNTTPNKMRFIPKPLNLNVCKKIINHILTA